MSEDIATIGVKADTRDLKRGERALGGFASKGEATERRVSKSSRVMSAGMRTVAKVAGAMTLSLGAVFSSGRVIAAADQYENRLLRLQSIVDATGGVAGRTSEQLEAQAQSLARATLESVDGVMRAQQTLLTFRNVQGEVFDRAIEGALDLAAAMETDVRSATLQLAKALEDPVTGMTALTRSGTVFTEAQKDMVRAMVEAGDTAGAQNFILDELDSQYGGAAQAVSRLASVQDSLGQSFNNLLIRVNEVTGATEIWASMIESVDGFVRFLSEDADALENGLKGLGVVVAALAATQLPAVVAGLGAMVTAMTTAGGVAGVLTTAMRVLGGAAALAGGPLGLLLGVVGGAAAAMILFRDNTDTVAPIVDGAKRAVDEINAVLATSSEVALPDAARETLNLTNENIKLAKSAYAAAEAELAKAEANAYAAQQQLGAESMSGLPFETLPGNVANTQAINNLRDARRNLSSAESKLTDKINEGQLALSESADAMAENRKRAIELSITQEDLAWNFGGAAGGAGKLTDEMKQMQTEMDNANMASERWANSMAGHFDGLITGGKDFSGVLMSIARQLESSAWQSLFSGNLFGGGGGGGGLLGLGGFLGFLDKGGSIGPDQFAIAGERGPEIVRGPAHVTSRADTARMMQGNGGGGQVVIKLDLSRDVEARIMQNTTGQTVQIVSSALGANRQALPGQIDTISNRGE